MFGHCKKAGFTLIELLVVIAIIAILAAILFPVFAQAREKARAISCVSNEKQMGLALLQYEQDYDEFMPMGQYLDANGKSYNWQGLVQPYVKNGSVNTTVAGGGINTGQGGIWACPSFPGTQWNNYGINDQLCPAQGQLPGYHVNSIGAVDHPAGTILVLEKGYTSDPGAAFAVFFSELDAWDHFGSDPGTCSADGSPKGTLNPDNDWDDAAGAPNPNNDWEGPGGSPRFRHQGTCNSLFVDGHVKAIHKGQMNWCQYIYSPGITQIW
ncbi:MAG: prepilin-type N-terminal cleavage/methylation domain [Capsulimonas sp.]|jgi:prepilin-type N-terminal cleavage/methylation domain-containing protein/prepilin-type processing-associated H-X9-DG protein|nr:prepilin-type N-terminal cleavage/methylation domain [Capsulimonas sp.]